jgi:hypothetical protein
MIRGLRPNKVRNHHFWWLHELAKNGGSPNVGLPGKERKEEIRTGASNSDVKIKQISK